VHKDLKFGPSKEAFDDARLSTDPFDGIAEFATEMGQIDTAHVAKFDSLQVCPEPLAGVQLRGIRGEALHAESRRRPIGQERGDDTAAVNGRSIPDNDEAPGHLAQQMFQKGDHSLRIERAVLAGEIPLGFGRDGADGREMIPGVPLLQDGRVPHWRRGAHDTGQGIAAGFVYKEDGVPLGFRPFLMAGQVS
jgi:hypothetical protein